MFNAGCAINNKYYSDLLKTASKSKRANGLTNFKLDGYYENVLLRKTAPDSLMAGIYKVKNMCPKSFVPIIFFKNGNALFTSTPFCGDSLIEFIKNNNFINHAYKYGEWGVYSIVGNKIYLTTKYDSLGLNSLFYNRIAKFEGEILNDSTIVNWHSSHPDIFYEGKNLILKFVKEPRVNTINPEKAWINSMN